MRLGELSALVLGAKPLGLLLHREIVIHELHAPDEPRCPRRISTGREILDFAGQRDHPRIGLNGNTGFLQVCVLGDILFDACRYSLIPFLQDFALRRGHHFEVVLHRLDAIEEFGDVPRRLLGHLEIDLTAEHHDALRGLDNNLPPFDPTIDRKGIFVFPVSPVSLIRVFSVDLSAALTNPVMQAPPIIRAAQNVRT